ncbi:MAG: hypothetical protein R2752_07680 [Vicinamibacterales bacterium]
MLINNSRPDPRRRRVCALLVLVAPLWACSGGTTRPDGPTTPSTPRTGTGTIAGLVVHTLTGTPVAGATLAVEGQSATTDTAGRFSLAGMPVDLTGRVTISGEAIVTRQTRIQFADERTGVTFDVIPATLLDFYRQFARNGYESPGFLFDLSRWVEDPHVYIDRITTDSGTVVPEPIVEEVARVIRASVPELTGNQFKVVATEVGDVQRPLTPGWLNVEFRSSLQTDQATGIRIGATQGRRHIELLYSPELDARGDLDFRRCGSVTIMAADHEIVHAMGFYHTDDPRDFESGDGCPGTGRPERAVQAAAIVYARAPDNRDPDFDPIEVVFSTSDRSVVGRSVTCTLSDIRGPRR